MTLNYTSSKNIIIEAKESCRVPVPVEKCPLERLLAENVQSSDNNQCKYDRIRFIFDNIKLFISIFR